MEMNVDNFTKMCRTCLSEAEEMLCPISKTALQDGFLVVDALSSFLPTMDLQNNELPQQICSMCIENLNLFCNFRNTCNENEKMFKSCLEKCDIKTEKEFKTEDDDMEIVHNSPILCSSTTTGNLPLIDGDFNSSEKDSYPPMYWNPCKVEEEPEGLTDSQEADLKLFSCKHCNKTFQAKYKLNAHAKIHSKERPFRCNECNLGFKFKGNLKNHIMAVHVGERPHICKICGKGFTHLSVLKTHMLKVKHNRDSLRQTFTCKICSRAYTRIKNYRLHMTKCHPQECDEELFEKSQEVKNEPQKAQYKCAVCGYGFAKLQYLKRHEFRHGEKKFLCSDCGKGFIEKAELTEHLKNDPVTKANLQHLPEYCPRGENGKAKRRRCNICWSNGQKRKDTVYYCPQCPGGPGLCLTPCFRIHTGEKPHQCPICNKSFSHATSLISHRTTAHSTYRRFSCDTCSKSFSLLQTLKLHERVHNGERPYPCSYCDKTFACKSYLTVHVRTHTGETPHVCTTCGKRFHRSSTLQKHKRSHMSLAERAFKEAESVGEPS